VTSPNTVIADLQEENERLKKALGDLIADMELCCYPVMDCYSGQTRFDDYKRALADAKKALKGEAL